ncbi:MAG TPA: ribose-phosphate diphosphokinase [Steroidobacteraceae bacterium]|nr:ribose-phosphate diphosphokinase [Steroidobacteraceae bacterium]
MMLFAPALSAVLASKVAESLGIRLATSEEREFDGGEHKMRSLEDVRGEHAFVIHSLCGNDAASANDRLCRLLFLAGGLKDAGASRVTTVVPYLPYARKDRRTQPRDPVTTRYVAAMFEAVGVDCVVVLDIHNDAAFDNAFRIQTVRLEAAETFAAAVAGGIGEQRVVVASPDIGGIKRAQKFRETLSRLLVREVDFAFVEKRRTQGVVSGEALVGSVEDAEIVFYDDMIVSGTTLVRAVNVARRAGARQIRVAAPHAAFAPAAAQLFQSDGPDTVLVSDSIPLRPEFMPFLQGRLQVCSIAPLIAKTIGELA